MLSHLIALILQSPGAASLSAAAIMATVTGGILVYARRVPAWTWRVFLRLAAVEMTVTNGEVAFDWIETWLDAQPQTKRSQVVMLRAARVWDPNGEQYRETWKLVPGNGSHLFRFSGRFFYIQRSSTREPTGNREKAFETIRIVTLGRSTRPFYDIVNAARLLENNANQVVSVNVWSLRWRAVPGKTPRSLDTIVIEPEKQSKLLADIDWFISSPEWYHSRGIPYRRGYLFSGPPGTGKTSIVLGIATYLRRPICILSLSSVPSDTALFAAISDAPNNSIILIEDIDCATASAVGPASVKSDETQDGMGVTKAGLLNALDGISVPDGRIFIMTTNHPERLDPAIVRPGRVDYREVFGKLEAPEQMAMALRFYADAHAAFKPLPSPVTAAEMQEAFMLNPDNPSAARAYLVRKTLEIAS